MSYIGRGLDKISNIEKLDAITFDGSQSYSLTKSSVAFTPNSVNSLIISINGVCQFGNVTVSGTSVDFGVAMPSTDTNDFILHLGVGVVNTPADATVTSAKLSGALVTPSTLDVSGVITGTTVEPSGDTASGDNAAIGYTSAEGLILTGQGSTNDVTIKNDADGDVISIPTGTTNVTIAGDLTISGDDLTMGTNTSGAILVADGTNYNPAVVSGDATIATNGALTIANNAVSLAKMAGGTDGNIISYDASGDPVAIATGTDGQVLTSAGAGAPPAFEDASGGTNTPSFSVTLASAQSISAQTTTAVTWDSEAIDTDSAFASNVFTIPAGEGGKYFFGVNLNIVSANMTQAQIFLTKDGSVIKKQMFITDGTQDNHSESLTAVIDASAADYFGVSLWVIGAATVSATFESSFHGFKLT